MAAPMIIISPQKLTNFSKYAHQCFNLWLSNNVYGNTRYFSGVAFNCRSVKDSGIPRYLGYLHKKLSSSRGPGQAGVNVRAVCAQVPGFAECQQDEVNRCRRLHSVHDRVIYSASVGNNFTKEFSAVKLFGSRQNISHPGTSQFFCHRAFHTTAVYSFNGDKSPTDPDDPDYEPPWREKPASLRLSSWPAIIWPSLLKTIKNWFLTVLIKGYMDETYTSKTFLDGAEQAVITVSEMLSGGEFQNLREMQMIDDTALGDAQVHYADLNVAQRQLIRVDPEDLFFRYVYEIGMIFDDMTEQRFVEITTVFQGCPGLAEARKRDPWSIQKFVADNADQLYICNYRFIREFTKGVNDDWVINKLNHFLPKEIADSTPPFSR